MLDNTKLEVNVKNNELIAIIPIENCGTLTDIFDVTLVFGDREETCHCWTFNREMLKRNREKLTDVRTLKDFDINPNSDKYLEDRRRLLEAELMCLPDILSYREKSVIFDQLKEEAEADEDDIQDSSDFVVDIDIPDEYRAAYRQYQYVEKLRGVFSSRFFSMNSGCLLPGSSNKIIKSSEGLGSGQTPTCQARMATTEEKSFERFVKRRVKGMLDDQYVAAIGMEHYLALITVIFEIYDKYNKQENVEDIFQKEYVAQTRAELMGKALKKDRTKEVKEFDNVSATLLEQSYKVIFDNYEYRMADTESDAQYKYDQINKKLLQQMQDAYGIRNIFKEHIVAVITGNSIQKNMQQISALVSYIDKLFGYKGFGQLEKFIETIYSHPDISLKGTVFTISALSTNITSCFKPDIRVLQEIKKYSRNVAPIEIVKIIIRSAGAKSSTRIDRIEHKISMNRNSWSCSIYYKNGARKDDRAQYISI